MGALLIEDMSKTYLEHSMVIHNFVIKVGNQIKDSLCRVFGDSVQYQWHENDDKVVIPDVSIICNMRDRKNVSFTGIPRFVMEVLSDATEDYDRNEKMDIYRKVGVSEYWIVDWRKKQVEIYMFDFKDDDTSYAYLYKTITAENKEELQIVMFPNLHVSFDELFDIEQGAIYITIQQKIDAARAYKGVTQQQLADAFGITVQAMGQRLKTGKFTQQELEKIASVLDAKYQSYFEFSDGTKF